MEEERYIRPAAAGDEVRLGYRLWRAGPGRPLLVMVHGLASNLTRWSEFVAETELSASWDLLRLDLRGHGLSVYRGHYRREDWRADLAAILDAEGYASAVVMGHSLGAEVAMDFAQAYPQRTDGIILIDPVFPPALRGVLGLGHRLHWLTWLAVRLCWAVNALGLRRRRLPYRDLRALDEQTRRLLAAAADRADDANIAQFYMKPWADLHYIPMANYLQDVYEVVRPVPDPASLDMPTLVLLSAGASISDARVNRDWIARFPCARTVTIDADHWLLTERPVQARRAIEVWCRALAAGEIQASASPVPEP